jgi:hypothetical protein
MTTREELDRLSTQELHDRAMAVAKKHMDAGFLWRLVKALPVAEEMIGHDQRSKVDIMRPLALINDYQASGSGEIGDALRPLFIEEIESHDELSAEEIERLNTLTE